MLSRPVPFILLALGCLTAAGGGAYLATRHNAADPAVAATMPATVPEAVSRPATETATPPAVSETEAAVTPEKADQPAAEAPATVANAERPVRARQRRAEPKPAPSRRADPPAKPVARTIPMTSTQPAVVPEPPVAPLQAVPAAAEPVKAVPPPQPAPEFEEVIVPASAVIGLQLETSTSSERARVEDPVEARVSRDVMAAGRVAIPAGTRVLGNVTMVERGGKLKEQARLGIRFHTLVLADGSRMQMHTEPIYRAGEPPAGDSAKKIGGAAIGGAILGAILGGGKGAAIGGATGAAGGTAAVMGGERSAATLNRGENLTARLSSPLTITVEGR